LKNANTRVFLLTLSCFIIYFSVSVFASVFQQKWDGFDRINLLSDIFTDPKNHQPVNTFADITKDKPKAKTAVDSIKIDAVEDYKKGNEIINFKVNDSATIMSGFYAKLKELKEGKNIKIRIAYFGDSMIEGDLLTSTLRQLLQSNYGGSGVGYVPITSPSAGFRQTVTSKSDGWENANFSDKKTRNLYFSGYKFWGYGNAYFRDNTVKDTASIEKSLLYGKTEGNITANGKKIVLNPKSLVNRQVIDNNQSSQIKLSSNNSNIILYGVSFESQTGVIVDNFSFRGITGIELNKLDEDFLKSINEANPYDLIVFQYGVNLLFQPNNKDFSYFENSIKPVFKKMKNAFPNSNFLLVGSADRAFKYKDEYKTAVGLPVLLELQAKLAKEYQFAFYNQFASMGGENSIVKWAQMTPALANKDYVHPNGKGADLLARKLFAALQHDFQKYENQNLTIQHARILR